ncbi:MAG: hypothetical protein AAGG75_01770 [Bacteroidota bacterium]
MSAKMKSNPAQTVLTISVGFLVIYYFTRAEWALWVAMGIGIIGVFSTYLSKKMEWAWMKLAWLLSLIVPKILLSIVFFLFLSPIAWIAGLLRKTDPLMLKNKQDSTFTTSNKTFDKSSFGKPW